MSEPAAALIVSPTGVAALLGLMGSWEVLAVHERSRFDGTIHTGNAIQTVKTSNAKGVITIRPATFGAAGMGGNAGIWKVRASVNSGMSAWVKDKVASTNHPKPTAVGIAVLDVRCV